MAEEKDKQIVDIFEDSIKELLEFHCSNNFPFYKEAEAQAWLYMQAYKKLKKKGLLFHKCENCKKFSNGRSIIRLLPKYPGKKRKFADFAITPYNFCPYEKETKEKQEWLDFKIYKYLIIAEIKSWNKYSKYDLNKLSTFKVISSSNSRLRNKYFILLGDEYSRKKSQNLEILKEIKKVKKPKSVYKLNENQTKKRYRDCNIYYGLIYSKDRDFKYDGPFAWTEKGNLHIYTNKGLIKS